LLRETREKDPLVAGNINEREGPLMYKVAPDKGQIPNPLSHPGP